MIHSMGALVHCLEVTIFAVTIRDRVLQDRLGEKPGTLFKVTEHTCGIRNRAEQFILITGASAAALGLLICAANPPSQGKQRTD